MAVRRIQNDPTIALLFLLFAGCQTVPKSKHKLKDHIRSHTQEKVVACPTCGGLFSNATKFFDHIKRQSQSDGRLLHSRYCVYEKVNIYVFLPQISKFMNVQIR